MPTKVATLPNVFTQKQSDLREVETQATGTADAQVAQAKASVAAAGARIDDAFANAGAAGHHIAEGALAGAAGVADFAAGVGYSVDSVAHETAGAMGESVEEARNILQKLSRGVSRVCQKIAEVFANLGNEDMVTTRSMREQDPAIRNFYERQYAQSDLSRALADQSFSSSWNAWSQSFDQFMLAGGSVAQGAQNIASAAGNMGSALAHMTVAGAAEAGATVAWLGQIAVQAAQNGVVGAADLSLAASRYMAGVSNAVALPDQAKITVNLDLQMKGLKAALAQAAKVNPSLAPYVQQFAAQ